MRPFHRPGVDTKRIWMGYDLIQDATQRALSEIAYAAAYGFIHTRQPRPGAVLPAAEVDAQVQRTVDRWNHEAKVQSRGARRGMNREDLPQPAWQYLTLRLRAVTELREGRKEARPPEAA